MNGEDLVLTGAELVAEHTGRPISEGGYRAVVSDGNWRAFYGDPLVSDEERAASEVEEPEGPDGEHEAFCAHHDGRDQC